MSMTILGVAAQLALSTAVLNSPELSHFPGSYFDTTGRTTMHRRVMERWPGPSALEAMWHAPGLKGEDRVAILLGGAAYHDPVLLPIYRAGLGRPWEKVRQAAAYGFRDLIGDRLSNVAAGLDERDLRRMGFEMDSVRTTLLREPLVAMWLHALLRNEKKRYPGFRGFAPPRRSRDCLLSIEKVMTLDDLDLLVRAYQVSDNRTTQIGLLRLIESLTLSRFIVKPKGTNAGWGPEVFDKGMANLDAAIERWTSRRCTIRVNRILASRMAEMGAPVSNPRSAEACYVWHNVLRFGDPGWWPTAAKQLYLCGGPWIELSVLWSESETNVARRDELLGWYRTPRKETARPPAQPVPPP